MGVDNKGYFMALVLVHADNKAAEQNVQLLEQRLNQLLTLSTSKKWIDLIDYMEIDSQGLLTLAKFYGKDMAMIYIEEIHYRIIPLLLSK